MSNVLLVAVLLAVVAIIGFWLFRRSPDPTVRPSLRNSTAPAREAMLQIVIPATGACCAAARQIESSRFYKQSAPSLPLPDCSMKTGCHCRYQPVPDRRVGDRRQHGEKRETIRYEENPRRHGKGRRAVDKLFDHD